MSDSNPLIPKEQLSAYQRWELAPLSQGIPAPPSGGNAADRAVLDADVAQIKQDAHNEGYAAGYTAGVQRAVEEKSRLGDLVGSLTQARQLHEDAIAKGLLDLSLTIVKRMLNAALPVHHELMLPMVREAIDQLPQTSRSGTIHLHPADVDLVQTYLREEIGEHGFRLSGDAHIERGGCRIQAGECEVDATLPTRWDRILSALSRNDAWIDIE